MLMRPVAAIFAVAMLTLACVSLSRAQGLTECVAKDEVIASVLLKAGTDTHSQKLDGDLAKILKVDMLNNGVQGVGESYVIFWKDGDDNNAMLIAIFDEHNCYDRVIKGPRDKVLELLAGEGA